MSTETAPTQTTHTCPRCGREIHPSRTACSTCAVHTNCAPRRAVPWRYVVLAAVIPTLLIVAVTALLSVARGHQAQAAARIAAQAAAKRQAATDARAAQAEEAQVQWGMAQMGPIGESLLGSAGLESFLQGRWRAWGASSRVFRGKIAFLAHAMADPDEVSMREFLREGKYGTPEWNALIRSDAALAAVRGDTNLVATWEWLIEPQTNSPAPTGQ